MKKQLFILIFTALILTNTTFAQDAISDFLKQKNQPASNTAESQALEYFRAIINLDAEGIYKFMNPTYANTFANKNKALEAIRDEFDLMRRDDMKIVSIKIKPESANSSQLFKLSITVDSIAKPGDSVTVDGEMKAVQINNNWYFYHKNYYLNSLQPYGMVRAADDNDEGDTSAKKEEEAEDEDWEDEFPNAGVLNGKTVLLPMPEYPSAAKAAGAKGTVIVEVLVNEKGDVVSAEAVSGHKLLQPISVESAKRAKFNPMIVDGKAVKFTGKLIYIFGK